MFFEFKSINNIFFLVYIIDRESALVSYDIINRQIINKNVVNKNEGSLKLQMSDII